jgi:outer membrane protein TolC
LLELEKRVRDAQDVLLRFMSDSEVHLASEVELVPVTAPGASAEDVPRPITERQALTLAMAHNPVVQQAKASVEVAEINIRVAQHQKMPRLDLVGSASTQALARDLDDANGDLGGDYASYAAGLVFEFPLGNRERRAELMKRRLERRKATAVLHNIADQAAVQTKERLRKVETNLAEIQLQREVVEESRVFLEALGESEAVRERLTAEFLLVKLQAQETLAQAERAENSAVTQFNIALAELAQATGTVFDLNRIEASLSALSSMAVDAAPDGEDVGQ